MDPECQILGQPLGQPIFLALPLPNAECPSQGIRHKPSSFLAVGIQGEAETEVVVAVVRRVPVPVRRPTIRGIVVPTAATVHAVRALKVRPPR